MEIALENAMPSYSGGLASWRRYGTRGSGHPPADGARLPSLSQGYFLSAAWGRWHADEEPVVWRVEDFLTRSCPSNFPLENRRIELRAWRYTVKGVRSFEVPVYFLDADLPSNAEGDRALTGSLYGADAYYRLCQEVLLGIGGVRILRALGYTDLTRYHMNEGHAALLSLELLEKKREGRPHLDPRRRHRKSSPQVRFHHAHSGARRARRFPMEYVTRVFPDQTAFFDLKDSTSADLMKRCCKRNAISPIYKKPRALAPR